MPSSNTWVHGVARHLFVGPALRLMGLMVVSGAQHIPRTGPVVLAANHTAAVDSFYVALAARRDVAMLAKREYFDGVGVVGAARRATLVALGQIPVDRDGPNPSSSIDFAVDLLRRDQVWGVHPEGTRTPVGTVHRGHTGVVRAACRAGAPVIPVAVDGCDRRPSPSRRITVDFLPPLDLTGVVATDRDGVRTATDVLMRRIADHLGHRYVDTYAIRGGVIA